MVFSSDFFLFYFLPLFLVAYYATPRRLKNAVALAASLLFYAWGAPLFVYVLAGSTLLDYLVSRSLERESQKARRTLLVSCSVVANVALLAYFKYANFFVEQLNALIADLGAAPIPWTKVALPIGISFFTFHKISYVVDVHRGTAPAARSYADCLLYFLIFPQLIAGPIVRYHDVEQQIRARVHTTEMFWWGVRRFTLGLVKKAILANAMAAMSAPIFERPIEVVPQSLAWLGAVTYYFQIYFDFSGYSDMALGLAGMMGFRFLENFQRPYVAKTFTDFWRRWHISLSNFMREYIYIPLGGNRVAVWRQYLNLWIVFLVSGFWHGASWNFVVWGAYQGVFLTIDKLGWSKVATRVPGFVLRPVMVLLVMFSWVIFNTSDLTHSVRYLDRMLCGGGPPWTKDILIEWVPVNSFSLTMLFLAALVAFLPWSERYLRAEQHFLEWTRRPVGAIVLGAITFVGLALGCLAVVNSSYNPFIYFRF